MVDWLTVLYVSIPWGTVLSLVVYFIKNPEKAEKWLSILTRSVSNWSQRAERATIATDIQSDIGLFSKTLNKEAGDQILPDGIKIEWERGDVTKEAFLREKLVIVRMNHHKNQARNFLNAALSYVAIGFLSDTRYHLDPIVQRSLDLTMVRKILSENRRSSALHIFHEEIYETERGKEPLIHKYYMTIDALDEQGMLNFVLKEFYELGLVMYHKAPDDNVKVETREFLDFMEKIATKPSGVDVPLQFKGNAIRIGIVLVARPELARLGSTIPYVNAVIGDIDWGANTVYVVARGSGKTACINIAQRVGRIFEDTPSVRKVATLKQKLPFYKGSKMSSITIILKSIPHEPDSTST